MDWTYLPRPRILTCCQAAPPLATRVLLHADPTQTQAKMPEDVFTLLTVKGSRDHGLLTAGLVPATFQSWSLL